MLNNCEICYKKAYSDVAWGGNCGTLCETHINELWNKIEPLLKANLTYFTIGPIGTLSGLRVAIKRDLVTARVHPFYYRRYTLKDGEKYRNGLYQIYPNEEFQEFYNRYKCSLFFKVMSWFK